MKMLEQYNYLYLLFFLLFSVTIFLYKWLRFRNLVSKNLPPSPPKLPIIGNLHQLSKNLHISLGSLAQKYGPLMLLKFGSVPVLVVSTADAAQEILKSHDLVFSDRPDSSISNRILYNGKDVALARYSEYWRQVKSVCVTQLLSKKRVSSFHNVREEEVALLIQTIENSHSTVNLSELFSELTSSVVCRVALGKKYEIGGGVSHKKLLGEMTELLGFFRSIGKYIPLLSWVDWLEGLKGKVEKIANEIDSFLEGVVIDHQNAIASDNSYANKDFISILLEIQKDKIDSDFLLIDKECIKAVILDMFFAGTETASTTLEWTIAAVLKNPNVMLKLQNEVREICKGKPKVLEADLVEMHYLKAVIKESMRMYIAAPLLLPRAAREDVKVMGYDIKAGTQVLVNAWAIARDPSLWDKAEEFRPERFLNSPIDYKGQHYEYLPFGAGRRACPGIRFAMNLMELAIANLVHKFDFELPDGGRMEDLDMTSESGITVRKKSPLLVIATPNV